MQYINFLKKPTDNGWCYLKTSPDRTPDNDFTDYKARNIGFAEVCMQDGAKILPVINDFINAGGWDILNMPGYVNMRIA